jgi:hypothetical protein
MIDLEAARKAIHFVMPDSIFMCDLETVALTEDAYILSIGGLVFKPSEGIGGIIDADGKLICPSFEIFISGEDQEGRIQDPNTVKWWDGQPASSRELMFGPDTPRMSLEQGIDFMLAFLEKTKPTHGSANSPSFDFNILKHAMRPYTKKFNFPYWNEIDYRSIENFVFGTNVRKEGMPFHFGTKHTALDDSISQAIALCYIYQWRREVDQAYGGGTRTRGG